MDYFLYAILGIAPSVIWLVFYLRQDFHPEPKRKILLVFLTGALMGPLALAIQFSILALLSPQGQWESLLASIGQNQSLFMLNIILIAPLSEEVLKYIAARRQALKSPEFDEPVDAMVYLIVSALGFAASENLLNIFMIPNITLQLAVSQATLRFLSATFLHTLASGILGYFTACSLLNFKNRKFILTIGFLTAISFHSFYNYLAWLLGTNKFFALAIASFLALAGLLINKEFRCLKNRVSICKIK